MERASRMISNTFGKTGISVAPLGFGSGPIGYLKTDQADVTKMLNFLLDHGVNVIDTAARYLQAEELITKAVGRRRSQYILVSKCGHKVEGVKGKEWSAEIIHQTVDRSLKRLATDYIDVMLLHSCDMGVLKQGDALQALVEARDAGKVRFVGYSGDNKAASYAASLPEISVVQVSFNICDQANIDTVLPVAHKFQVGVIAKRPMANGAWEQPNIFRSSYTEDVLLYLDRFKQIGLSPLDFGFNGPLEKVWPNVALRFTLFHSGAHTAIVGTTSLEHAKANVIATQLGPLPEAIVSAIRHAFQLAQRTSTQEWAGMI
jgi:aryl-alcohol dehydrogenase-like predicted oxidoreductase